MSIVQQGISCIVARTPHNLNATSPSHCWHGTDGSIAKSIAWPFSYPRATIYPRLADARQQWLMHDHSIMTLDNLTV
jgi:hypothetical protein